MSPRRARLLIFCVWVLSFIVCFPPLIGWNERGGLDFGDDVTHRNWTRPPTDDVMRGGAGPEVRLVGDPQRDDAGYDVVDSSATSQRPGAAVTQQCGDVTTTR